MKQKRPKVVERKGRLGPSLKRDDAPALARALEHSLRCWEPGCERCLEWEEILEDEGSASLASVIRSDAALDDGAPVDSGAVVAGVRDLLGALTRARESPTMWGQRGVAEECLQRLAGLVGVRLPAPRYGPRKERPRLVSLPTRDN